MLHSKAGCFGQLSVRLSQQLEVGRSWTHRSIASASRDGHLSSWHREGHTLRKTLKFRTFSDAWQFMTAVALLAEKLNHHPDWSNSYTKVDIRLRSHDQQSLTQRDYDLAERIDRVEQRMLHRLARIVDVSKTQ